jgi:hypothetical protein
MRARGEIPDVPPDLLPGERFWRDGVLSAEGQEVVEAAAVGVDGLRR